MNKKILFVLFLFCFCLTGIKVFAITIDELLVKIQHNMDMVTDISAHVVFTQSKPQQGVKVIDSIYYRRDKDDAFLIVMLAPETDKGNGYLRIDDNFWMYRRNTRTFAHINRDESIGGTNAKGSDFERRKLPELYEGVKDNDGKDILTKTMLGKIPVYRFEVKAKVNDVDYPKKTYWIREDNFLVLKEQDYSSSNTLMLTAYFRKYTTVNERFIPVEHLYIDEFEKGNKTIVEITNISTDKLDDSLFTKAYLENLSK